MEKKIAVVYRSKYGSSRKYAQWIADELNGDLFESSSIKGESLKDYQIVVLGGGIHAGGIEGIAFLQKNFDRWLGDKKLCAFAVGLNINNEESRKECREINFKKEYADVPCFFLPGAYDPKKITFMDRGIIKVVKKMLAGADDDYSKQLLKVFQEGGDFTDREAIRPLVEQVRSYME